MKQTINKPTQSKINWVSLASLCAGILVTADVVPDKWNDIITQAALIVTPAVVIMLRTWFTEPKNG